MQIHEMIMFLKSVQISAKFNQTSSNFCSFSKFCFCKMKAKYFLVFLVSVPLHARIVEALHGSILYDHETCRKFATSKGVGGYLMSNFSGFQHLLKEWDGGKELATEYIDALNKNGKLRSSFNYIFGATGTTVFTFSNTSFPDLVSSLRPICAYNIPRLTSPGNVIISFSVKNLTLSGKYLLKGKFYEKHLLEANGPFKMQMRFNCIYRIDIVERNDVLQMDRNSSHGACSHEGLVSKASFDGSPFTVQVGEEKLSLKWFQATIADMYGKTFGLLASHGYENLFAPAFEKFLENSFTAEKIEHALNFGYA